MKNVDEVGLVLLRAAEYIRDHGWCQDILENAAGNVCMLGALAAVTATSQEASYAYDRLMPSPVEWNDTPGRTEEEVIAELQRCAFREDNRGKEPEEA